MGFFKNELLADQVEIGDRVPAPRPASTHVAFNHSVSAPVTKTRRRYNGTVALMLGVGFVVGFGIASVIGVL